MGTYTFTYKSDYPNQDSKRVRLSTDSVTMTGVVELFEDFLKEVGMPCPPGMHLEFVDDDT